MHETFNYFQPTFLLMLCFLVVLLVMIVFQKKKGKVVNGFTVFSFSFICIAISSIQMYLMGILADELGVGGDPNSFFMYLIIVGLSILNIISYLLKK